MKTLRLYGDGYGASVTLKHDDSERGSGYFYIRNDTPGEKSYGFTFRPEELAELVTIISKVIEANRAAGVFPYTGKVGYIDGMEVRIQEPAMPAEQGGRG